MVFAGTGRADGVAVLFHVGIAGRVGGFARRWVMGQRLYRSLVRGPRPESGPGRSDQRGNEQEQSEDRNGEQARKSHENTDAEYWGFPCCHADRGNCTIILVCLAGAVVTMGEGDTAPKETPAAGIPAGVRTIAVVLFLASAVSFLTGSSLLFPEVAWWHRLWELNRPANAFVSQEHLATMAGVLLLALGIVTATTGWGLLRGRRWAWWIAVAVFAINGCGDLLTLIVQRDVVKGGSGVLIASVFLFLLMRSGTRRYFVARS